MKFLLVVSSCLIVVCSSQEPTNDKTYNFRYSTGNEGPAQIWREERREADGTVVGRYGYVDPNGEQRVVEYRANPESGFQASGDTGPDNAALRHAEQAQADHEREVSRVMSDWKKAASRSPAAIPWSQKQSQPAWNPHPQQQARTSWNSPSDSAPSWPTASGNNAQWNNAWSNFNWNENNARVMADWNAPQRRSSWNSPSSAPAIQAPPATPSWANWNNNNQDFMRRSSPATAFRQQQQRAPTQPSWDEQPTSNAFSRRSGHSAVQVSQDPFSFSFGIDHNAK